MPLIGLRCEPHREVRGRWVGSIFSSLFGDSINWSARMITLLRDYEEKTKECWLCVFPARSICVEPGAMTRHQLTRLPSIGWLSWVTLTCGRLLASRCADCRQTTGRRCARRLAAREISGYLGSPYDVAGLSLPPIIFAALR